ncbi:8-oxo-dGTP pyrophosphatase MutT (NUDIX family) [Streptomyces sp. B4I13]|uniref:NUDIX hydrolase n=1 Tax=Streptomyces sp. B4I13 TaxID=3042271 RepID=UPI002781369F|nr:NUDIX domain-containing protein [Streptomyces sp. B4I13]MDQ0963768.1 8-oxo-dGTP pyrophosphatase MutT (NUDIX family) [Streptomyces sp. B4I13]
MPTPEFITEIRASAGHRLLWLPGVSAVVFDDEGRVLLGQRADNRQWTVISGIPDPGEQPADCAVREVQEEAGVTCVPERVVLVRAGKQVQYPNGDTCQFMDITFRCRAVGGAARVNDDESLDVGWFALDALPPLRDRQLFRIKQALSDEPTWFETTTAE